MVQFVSRVMNKLHVVFGDNKEELREKHKENWRIDEGGIKSVKWIILTQKICFTATAMVRTTAFLMGFLQLANLP